MLTRAILLGTLLVSASPGVADTGWVGVPCLSAYNGSFTARVHIKVHHALAIPTASATKKDAFTFAHRKADLDRDGMLSVGSSGAFYIEERKDAQGKSLRGIVDRQIVNILVDAPQAKLDRNPGLVTAEGNIGFWPGELVGYTTTQGPYTGEGHSWFEMLSAYPIKSDRTVGNLRTINAQGKGPISIEVQTDGQGKQLRKIKFFAQVPRERFLRQVVCDQWFATPTGTIPSHGSFDIEMVQSGPAGGPSDVSSGEFTLSEITPGKELPIPVMDGRPMMILDAHMKKTSGAYVAGRIIAGYRDGAVTTRYPLVYAAFGGGLILFTGAYYVRTRKRRAM